MPCSLYCTGSNSHGQLASSSTDDIHSFTQLDLPLPHSPSSRPFDLACGANHTLLLSHDGRTGRRRLYGAGSNVRGQLDPSSPADHLRLSFQPLELFPPGNDVGEGYEPTAVAACWETSFVVLRSTSSPEKDDLLLSFGANDWGELGNGSVGGSFTSGATNVRLDHLKEKEEEVIRAEKIRAGPRHVLALLSFHLPSPPSDSPSTSTSSIPAPSPPRHLLVGWGASRHGQLGPSPSSSAPTKTTPLPTAVSLPSPYQPSHILDLAVGKEHSAVLLSEATPGEGRRLWLFGSRRHGQLGPFPPEDPSAVEEDLAAGIRLGKGTVVFPKSNLLSASSLLASLTPSSLPSSPSSYDLSAVGCTWNGTYVVLSPSPSLSFPSSPSSPSSSSSQPDILLSFGPNTHGQLGCGRPSPLSAGRALSSSPSFPLASASAGQPHLVPLPLSSAVPSRIDRLACGSEHVLVHLHRPTPVEGEVGEGEVWGWGWNEHGNLAAGEEGGGELEDVWEPRRVWPPPSPYPRGDVGEGGRRKEGKVMGVWAGMATSWVLVEGCW